MDLHKDSICVHWRYGVEKDQGLILIEEHSNVSANILKQCIETKNKLVREALIELGWTPPKDDQQ